MSIVIISETMYLRSEELYPGLWYTEARFDKAPGCWGCGGTRDEAEDNFVDVYREWLRV